MADAPALFPTEGFITWLSTALTSAPWNYPAAGNKGIRYETDGFVPGGQPDRLITVTPSAGPGIYDEEAATSWYNVQLHVRGLGSQSNDRLGADDARQLAGACDIVLIGATTPVLFGSRRCFAIDHSGGPPTAFQEDQARRHSWVGTYRMLVSRT